MDAGALHLLSLGYGLVVGISLGLTGGGGSIFAVPLLIYGLGIPVRTAIGLSLASVGVTAGFGAALRLRAREVEILAGVVFALGGMSFAPLGGWLGHFIPERMLLSGFAILMSYVGLRMWRGKAEMAIEPGPCVYRPGAGLRAACYVRLVAAGAVAGLLSGLFGVGGGFIIVPALIYVVGTPIHRAVATSLLVICFISISGVVAAVSHGQEFPMPVSALFVFGGFIGMLVGNGVRSRLNDAVLRRVFAIAMWIVGAYLLVKNLRA